MYFIGNVKTVVIKNKIIILTIVMLEWLHFYQIRNMWLEIIKFLYIRGEPFDYGNSYWKYKR